MSKYEISFDEYKEITNLPELYSLLPMGLRNLGHTIKEIEDIIKLIPDGIEVWSVWRDDTLKFIDNTESTVFQHYISWQDTPSFKACMKELAKIGGKEKAEKLAKKRSK